MEDQEKQNKPENTSKKKEARERKIDSAKTTEGNCQPESVSPSDQSAEKANQEEAPAQVPMVVLSMEEYDALQNELKKAQEKSCEYFDGWQRERADFNNYKKRIDRDAVVNQQNALVSVVKKYLVILDDLDRALRTRPTHGEEAAWSDGVDLIYRKLSTLLEQEGIRRMEAEKEKFDPSRHEAIIQEDDPEHESGQIIEVIQQGYLLGDRVIRPALVRVAK